MAGDFPLRSLASVARVRSGCAFKSTDMGSAGVPVIKIKNITPPTVDVVDCERVPLSVIESITGADRYELSGGDILIAMAGATVGKVGRFPLTDEQCYLNQRVGKVYLTNPDKADYRFLYYVLSQDTYVRQIFGAADGSAQANVSGTQIESFQIPIPSLPEQRAIAHILGTLDDKIELNRRMNETLEAMARAIFKSWFVDFDPVRAKAEGRDPGLPKPLADLFPDSFEDSELGKIPKGWRVGTVDDVAIINARTLGRNDSLDTIDYIEISEVVRGEVNTITRYERGQEPSRARRRLQHGDTALSTVRPDRGAYFLSLDPAETLIASTGFAVLTPRAGQWAFLHTLTTRQEVGEELARLADGGAYPAVRPEVVGGLPIILPGDASAIDSYESLSQPLLRRAAMNRKESRTLAALRDTLLPKLLSGEIRVAVAEKIVEGVV